MFDLCITIYLKLAAATAQNGSHEKCDEIHHGRLNHGSQCESLKAILGIEPEIKEAEKYLYKSSKSRIWFPTSVYRVRVKKLYLLKIFYSFLHGLL